VADDGDGPVTVDLGDEVIESVPGTVEDLRETFAATERDVLAGQ
jgi:hypothetical protein